MLAFCTAITCAAPAAYGGNEFRVGMHGYGPLHIGMTTHQVEKAIGGKLVIPQEYENEVCQYVDLSGAGNLQDIGVMLWNGRVVRFDIRSKEHKTISGIGIGDSAQSIVVAYRGRVIKEPHAYTAPDGSYYTVYSRDKKFGVRFEIDHGLVTTFYVGRSNAIKLIEGCQ